jgi:hypothetical protein
VILQVQVGILEGERGIAELLSLGEGHVENFVVTSWNLFAEFVEPVCLKLFA